MKKFLLATATAVLVTASHTHAAEKNVPMTIDFVGDWCTDKGSDTDGAYALPSWTENHRCKNILSVGKYLFSLRTIKYPASQCLLRQAAILLPLAPAMTPPSPLVAPAMESLLLLKTRESYGRLRSAVTRVIRIPGRPRDSRRLLGRLLLAGFEVGPGGVAFGQDA
jgi:hypothetical protein